MWQETKRLETPCGGNPYSSLLPSTEDLRCPWLAVVHVFTCLLLLIWSSCLGGRQLLTVCWRPLWWLDQGSCWLRLGDGSSAGVDYWILLGAACHVGWHWK